MVLVCIFVSAIFAPSSLTVFFKSSFAVPVPAFSCSTSCECNSETRAFVSASFFAPSAFFARKASSFFRMSCVFFSPLDICETGFCFPSAPAPISSAFPPPPPPPPLPNLPSSARGCLPSSNASAAVAFAGASPCGLFASGAGAGCCAGFGVSCAIFRSATEGWYPRFTSSRFASCVAIAIAMASCVPRASTSSKVPSPFFAMIAVRVVRPARMASTSLLSSLNASAVGSEGQCQCPLSTPARAGSFLRAMPSIKKR